jgi:hypothetical protein
MSPESPDRSDLPGVAGRRHRAAVRGRCRAALVSALLVTAALVAGCGQKSPTKPSLGPGAGGGPGGGGGGGTPLSDASIEATIDSTEAYAQQLFASEPDHATRDLEIVSFLRRQSTVDSAGPGEPGCIRAVLKNRRIYLVTDNREPPDSLPAPGLARRLAPRRVAFPTPQRRTAFRSFARPVVRAGGGPDLPISTQARLLSAMNADVFGDAIPEIADELQRRGYQVITQRATVEVLRSITGDGVLYFDTHGDAWVEHDGAIGWALWTDTRRSIENDALYRLDLDDGSLCYVTGLNARDANGKDVLETHYAITSAFVHKYQWSFAPHALAFLDCCYGGYPGGAAASLRSLADPAAATIGWTLPVAERSNPTARYTFSRALGIPSAVLSSASPQRPFSLGEVHTGLQGWGWAAENTPNGPSQMVFEGAPLILTPQITYMEMHERIAEGPLTGKTSLVIHGAFGNQSGTVKINGVEVPVTDWQPTQVTCQPADVPGPGFSGDVEVSVDGRDSNAVPLTQWHGTATYEIDVLPAPVRVQCKIAMDVVFRGDVHLWRGGCESTPERMPISFRAAQGSTAHWDDLGSPPTGTSWVKPTSADLPFGLNGTVNAPYGTGYIFSGTLDADHSSVSVSFNFLGCVTAFDASPAPEQDLAPLHDLLLTSVASGVGTDGYPIYATNIPETIGSDFLIPGKSIVGVSPAQLEPLLVLGDFLPSEAPDPKLGEDMDPH